MIFCNQYSFDGWHQALAEGPVADAILDRIINSSYLITLYGKSIRKIIQKLKQQNKHKQIRFDRYYRCVFKWTF